MNDTKKKQNVLIATVIIILVIMASLISCTRNNESADKTSTEKKTFTPSDTKGSKHLKNVATRSKIDKFYFAGDINLSKNVKKAYDRDGVTGIIDEKYLDILKDGDVCFANLETPISDNVEEKADKKYTFALPTKYARALKEIGFNLYSLANNHVLDFGEKALLDTFDELDKQGLNYIGAGKNEAEAFKPYTIEIEGKKYAIFAISLVIPDESWKACKDKPGISNGFDLEKIDPEIVKYKEQGYKVFVYMHWGNELDELANDLQKHMAEEMVTVGADVVIGSHSHTLQEIEYKGNVPVVYSMGNFIFGTKTDDTFLLEVSVDYSHDEDGVISLKLYPGHTTYEKVFLLEKKHGLVDWIGAYNGKCKNCLADENGIIYSLNDEYVKRKIKESSIAQSNIIITNAIADEVGPGVDIK